MVSKDGAKKRALVKSASESFKNLETKKRPLDLYGRTLVILESESRDGGGSGWRDAEELEAVDVNHRVQGVLLAESEG